MRLYQMIFLLLVSSAVFAQEGASITGSIETNANVFLKDSTIGAYKIPQYEKQFFGGETWVSLNYSYKGLSAGIRYDMYINSNLKNPQQSYTDRGLGKWFIRKDFKNFSVQGGYIYDQIGSGIIFRSYFSRPLFIDNALVGIKMKYNLSDNWWIKAFGGQQKNAFDIYEGSLKGINTEGFLSFGNPESPITLTPGIGFMHKSIGDESMTKIIGVLTNYQNIDRFSPHYNSYATTFYNTLTYKNINWYVETSFKSKDIFYNQFAEKQEFTGTSIGKYVNDAGSVLYTSIGINVGKLGLTLEGKRTKNFDYRIDPNQRLLRGFINYIPPMNRQNTYRLTARYSPATQLISEQAYQVDARYKWSDKVSTLANFSMINQLDGTALYRELYTEVIYKAKSNLQLTGGLQIQNYNQSIYEQKDVPNVKTLVPYAEVLYKINRKKALRVEAQYMSTQQDYGSWMFALAEFSIAPKWIFEASGMYNVSPKKLTGVNTSLEKTLYPTLGVVFINDANRFSLRYVKQVEGIVCSGGICRLEPAFSGIRFNVTSTF